MRPIGRNLWISDPDEIEKILFGNGSLRGTRRTARILSRKRGDDRENDYRSNHDSKNPGNDKSRKTEFHKHPQDGGRIRGDCELCYANLLAVKPGRH
jgi:hypothetical protein